jgi:predicted transcriptional regulator
MKTVTLEVASREDVTRRALQAFRGKRQRARISFATPELLWKVLTARRWQILKAMAGQGPLTIREVARRVGRDVKAVHGDVRALIDAAVLERTETNRVAFPFDAIRVAFTLRAAWDRSAPGRGRTGSLSLAGRTATR